MRKKTYQNRQIIESQMSYHLRIWRINNQFIESNYVIRHFYMQIQMTSLQIYLNCLHNLFLMTDNYYTQESTNFQQNPFSKKKCYQKQFLIEENQNKFQEDNTNTLNFHDIQLPSKIFIPTDQQVTVNTAKVNKSMRKDKNKIKTNDTEIGFPSKKNMETQASPLEANAQVNIPVNKKVEQIMTKQPLRQKYIELLPQAYQKNIGYQHLQLIKVMGFIDNTIQFIAHNRSLKFIFFEDLKKQIKDSLRIIISMSHIQQILFLDEELYEVKWEFNQTKKAYDLQIVMRKIQSKDQRKQNLRRKILQFLTLKEQSEFGIQNTVTTNLSNWKDGFSPQKYEIPCKSLPIHPETKTAQIRGFDSSNISKIKNQNLKSLMFKKKQQSQVGSLKSQDVLQKLFNKRSVGDISTKILEAVKEKQKILEERKIKQSHQVQKTSLNKDIMKEICQQTMLIYVSKSVTNLFKVGLIQLLKSRTKYKVSQIQQNLQYLISMKEVCYLKQNITSNKSKVIQINKSKMRQMLDKIGKMQSFDKVISS